MDVADVSDGSGTVDLRDSAEPIDCDAMRLGGGPGVKTLPRASRGCATDLQRSFGVWQQVVWSILLHTAQQPWRRAKASILPAAWLDTIQRHCPLLAQ